MSESETDPLVGTVVDGRYRVLARLSEGGMGVVYRAEHVFLRREVALKRLHPELTGHGQAVARFEREAQAAARLDHPGICRVHDCGRGKDGAFFIAMDLLDGRSLDRRIADGAPLPLPEIVDLGIQLAEALEHAHGVGIVHRDLKPENVMLVARRGAAGEQVRILDFGIAKLAQEGDGRKLTQAGAVFGTPQYMAPEQAAGEAVDARADLYALGAILFEMATGRPPFEAPTMSALLTRKLTEPAPSLETAAPHLLYPPPFRDLVARCLERDPARRCASAVELAGMLRPLAGAAAFAAGPSPSLAPSGALQPTLYADGSLVPTSFPPAGDPSTFGTAPGPAPAAGVTEHAEQHRARTIALALAGVAGLALVVGLTLQAGGGSEASSGDAGARDAAAALPVRAEADVDVPAERTVVLPPPIRLPPPGPSLEGVAEAIRSAPATAGPSSPEAAVTVDPLEALQGERAEFERQEDVAAALAAAAGGREAEAISKLEWLAERLDGNPHYHFELATLYDRTRKARQAVEQADRAAELEPRYGRHPELLALADRALTSRDAGEAATRFFARVLAADTAEQLVRKALDAERPQAALRRVRDALEQAGLLEGLPAVLRRPLQAVTARSCAERKAVLRDIAAAPEPGMTPWLRRFRGESGCGILGMQDCWSCERSQIREALAALATAEEGGVPDAAP